MRNSIIISSVDLGIEELKGYQSLDKVLSAISWNEIAIANWSGDYPYVPQAKFRLAYDQNAIIIQYEIEEEVIKAQYYLHNDHIWEDSCVEFFISFDNKEHYYNFEFNPIGAGLIGYGTNIKAERSRLTEEQINQVEVFTCIERGKLGSKWNLIQYIPFNAFVHSEVTPAFLKENLIFANFYKCGDHLPKPHFLSWNKINHPTPNFHLPEFFGELVFE
ncbi:carbohydrate-binding family 9-like protein [Sphingobacterium faecium]|uniref:carbohydrate-binding family 9-like protein n=1 Tax=Sphingobacterium faecium TaxID=34087 RepID=UPI0032087457